MYVYIYIYIFIYIYIYIFVGGWGCESNREVEFRVARLRFASPHVRACDVERSKREYVCESECGSERESVVGLACASKSESQCESDGEFKCCG